MGKTGKMRKRQRKDETSAPPSKLIQLEPEVGDDESSDEEESSSSSITAGDLHSAIDYLSCLSRNLEVFRSKAMKSLRTLMFPLFQLQKKAYFEIDSKLEGSSSDQIMLRDKSAQAKLSKVVEFLCLPSSRDTFLSVEYKQFRKALHPLVLDVYRDDPEVKKQLMAHDRSFSARISIAFREKNWVEALRLLTEMKASGEPPKLGALQRWVRDCDLAPTSEHQASLAHSSDASSTVHSASASASTAASGSGEESGNTVNLSLLLLDAVMRIFHRPRGEEARTRTPEVGHGEAFKEGRAVIPTRAVIRRIEPFRVATGRCSLKAADLASRSLVLPTPEYVTSKVSVISHTPGPLRRPPSTQDLNVVMTAPNLVDFSSATPEPEPVRYDVPNVPGAFLMTGIISPWACKQIIHIAECIGYVPDAVEGIDNVIWLADDSLLDYVFEKCRPLLPPSLADCALRGINATWRLFRYYPGSVYRPHIDGAWPGSGIHPKTGVYGQDAFDGDRFSKLTFLVYLNDDFDGGETTFFVPDLEGGEAGVMEARGVKPSVGSILCFPHGDAEGSLVHEGSRVIPGALGELTAKYVIRTDVLFAAPKGNRV